MKHLILNNRRFKVKRIHALVLSISLVLFLAGCIGGKPAGDPKVGKELFTSKGCVGCHTIDGSPSTGPTLKGVYGHEITLATGGTVTSDDAYLKESILDPDIKVAKEFTSGIMSAVVSPGSVTDSEADDLVAYIKTLG